MTIVDNDMSVLTITNPTAVRKAPAAERRTADSLLCHHQGG